MPGSGLSHDHTSSRVHVTTQNTIVHIQIIDCNLQWFLRLIFQYLWLRLQQMHSIMPWHRDTHKHSHAHAQIIIIILLLNSLPESSLCGHRSTAYFDDHFQIYHICAPKSLSVSHYCGSWSSNHITAYAYHKITVD